MQTTSGKENQNNRFLRMMRNYGGRVYRWATDRHHKNQYQIIVSIIIGMVSGLVAVLLKVLVHWVRDVMYGGDPTSGRLGFVALPVLGIALSLAFVKLILRRPLHPGLSNLIYSISQKKVNLPPYETYAHVVTSSLTVGLGGSVGLEAPIIRTGSAIGANLARLLKLGRKRQTLYLACGAAAGMSAIFNSPVAGVIFAFEVLLTEMALHSFIPLLISAATGAVVAKMLYYEQLFFLPVRDWAFQGLPFYLALGTLCGALSIYIIRTTLLINNYLENHSTTLSRFLLGGLAIGILTFLMPPLFGEGYSTVNQLLQGQFRQLADHSPFYQLADNTWFIMAFAVLIILAKAVAASLTIALGGNGGIFAPSMFTGAMLGFVFAHGFNQLEWVQLNEANFIAVAMAGLLSGVFKSPLTGIFLIAELTGGYGLFVPLMMVSAISYFATMQFEPHSVFTRELYQKGLWVPSHERDLTILKNMDIDKLLETNFLTVRPEMTLGEFVKVIARSKRNIFPVVDEQFQLRGIVLLDDVREIMFDTDRYHKTAIKELMHNPPAVVQIRDPMEKVMDLFDKHHLWNIPVVDNGRYLGFVSKSSVFNRYRELLIERSREV